MFCIVCPCIFRYLYVTMLRDPVMRYLSEWKHVQRGGSAWLAAQLNCDGRQATLDEVPFCFTGELVCAITGIDVAAALPTHRTYTIKDHQHRLEKRAASERHWLHYGGEAKRSDRAI